MDQEGLKYPLSDYRDQLQIEVNQADPNKADCRDDYNAVADQWKPADWTYARVAPLSSKEFWSSQQVQSSITHQVNFRFYPGLTSTRHRLRQGQRVFNIESAVDLGNLGYEHECRCVEAILKPGETI